MSLRKHIATLSLAGIACSFMPTIDVFARQITADSLVGYWKLDETSGSSAIDSSGDGKTGTHQGSPTISADVPSGMQFSDARSLSFDGIDDYVQLPYNPSFTSGNSFTWSLWFKTNLNQNGKGLFSARDSGKTGTPLAEIYLVSGKIQGLFRGANGSRKDLEYTVNYADSAWHHVAVVINNGNGSLYFDGVERSTITGLDMSIDLSGVYLPIGASNYENTLQRFFTGNVNDVRIYSRALAAWEVSQLASGNHVEAFWKGKSGTAFERRQNWSGSYIPDPYSRLVIPSATGSLSLTGSIRAANLTINTGALMNLNGTGLTMNDSGTFTNYGTLALRNTETLSGLSIPNDKGTVMIVGSGSTTGLKTGTSYYNLTLNDGLIGYWKFDETSGTRATDSSGWGNSGSLLNDPTITTSVAPTNFTNGRSLSFDGVDDAVYMGDSASLQPNAITMSAWFRTTNTGYQRIIRKRWYGYSLNMNAGQIVTDIWEADGRSLTATSSSTYNDGAWHNAVATYDGSNVTLYVDGIRVDRTVGSGTLAIYYAAGGLAIGRDGDNPGDFFSGNIDDVRIYNRALRPGEVAALAAGNQPSLQRATITLNGALTINGSLTLNGGTLDVSTSQYGLQVGRSWLNNGGIFRPRSSTVTFTGTTSDLEILSGGQQFAKVTFNGAGGTWNIRDRLTASGAGVLTNGTLDTPDNHAMRFGQFTQNGGTIVPRSGTVVLTSHSNLSSTFTDTLNILRIEDPTESGLVGYWKFDEGTNTGAILDSSGYNNTGVRVGSGAIWTSSALADAMTFDNPSAMQFGGVGTAVNITVAGGIPNIPTTLTQAMWIKTTHTGSMTLVTRRNQHLNNNSDWATIATSQGGVAIILDDRSYANATDYIPVSDGEWHHVAGVKNGTTYSIYVDGTFRDSFTDARSMDGAPGLKYNIGVAPNWPGSNYIGLMDDVRVYNRVLSDAEILNLARGRYAAGNSSTATVTLGSDTSTAYLALDSGNLSTSTYALTVTNALTMLRGRGNLTLGSAATTLGGLIMSGATLTSAAGTLDINGDVTFSTGSIVAPSGYLTLSGDWTKTGGYFTANGGTLLLDGGDQALSGTGTFYNLTKSVTSASALVFGAGHTFTVEGTLTLNGAESNMLLLRSSSMGTPWILNALGTRGVEYLDVLDSTNIHTTVMNCLDLGCVDRGDNINWIFASPASENEDQGSGGRRGNGTAMIMAMRARQELVERYQNTVVLEPSEKKPVNEATEKTEEEKQEVVQTPERDISDYAGNYRIERQLNRVVLAAGDTRLVYKDVLADAWYAPYVSNVIQDDVARGYKDASGKLTGEFGVEKPVTKAEILKMALEASGKNTLKAAAPRNKTAQGSWATSYVGIAEALSLSIFPPAADVNASATRGEVVQLIMETMDITIGSIAANYSDVPKDHPYSHAIAAATFFGLIVGDTKPDGTPLNTFRPDALINRAEASKLIALARALQKMGAIAPPSVGGIPASASSSEPASSASSVQAAPELVQAKVIAQRLNIRIDSRESADKIGTIYFGHVVTILWPLDNGWSYIQTSYGKEGYVRSEYLELMK